MSIELSTRLALFARVDPAIYDHIPRGPLSRFEVVALNPQPLPPKALMAEAALAATAHTAAKIADAAIVAEALGLDAADVVRRAVSDWCGNEPRQLPWPKHWPWWWSWPEPEPEPEPWWRAEDMRAVAALVFSQVAERMEPASKVRGILQDGAMTLAEAAGI